MSRKGFRGTRAGESTSSGQGAKTSPALQCLQMASRSRMEEQRNSTSENALGGMEEKWQDGRRRGSKQVRNADAEPLRREVSPQRKLPQTDDPSTSAKTINIGKELAEEEKKTSPMLKKKSLDDKWPSHSTRIGIAREKPFNKLAKLQGKIVEPEKIEETNKPRGSDSIKIRTEAHRKPTRKVQLNEVLDKIMSTSQERGKQSTHGVMNMRLTKSPTDREINERKFNNLKVIAKQLADIKSGKKSKPSPAKINNCESKELDRDRLDKELKEQKWKDSVKQAEIPSDNNLQEEVHAKDSKDECTEKKVPLNNIAESEKKVVDTASEAEKLEEGAIDIGESKQSAEECIEGMDCQLKLEVGGEIEIAGSDKDYRSVAATSLKSAEEVEEFTACRSVASRSSAKEEKKSTTECSWRSASVANSKKSIGGTVMDEADSESHETYWTSVLTENLTSKLPVEQLKGKEEMSEMKPYCDTDSESHETYWSSVPTENLTPKLPVKQPKGKRTESEIMSERRPYRQIFQSDWEALLTNPNSNALRREMELVLSNHPPKSCITSICTSSTSLRPTLKASSQKRNVREKCCGRRQILSDCRGATSSSQKGDGLWYCTLYKRIQQLLPTTTVGRGDAPRARKERVQVHSSAVNSQLGPREAATYWTRGTAWLKKCTICALLLILLYIAINPTAFGLPPWSSYF